MLADSVEAAVKSIKDINPIKIDNMVRNIVKDKLYDGQLDESELYNERNRDHYKDFVKFFRAFRAIRELNTQKGC